MLLLGSPGRRSCWEFNLPSVERLMFDRRAPLGPTEGGGALSEWAWPRLRGTPAHPAVKVAGPAAPTGTPTSLPTRPAQMSTLWEEGEETLPILRGMPRASNAMSSCTVKIPKHVVQSPLSNTQCTSTGGMCGVPALPGAALFEDLCVCCTFCTWPGHR